ncbi:hypothetical protein AFM11_28185 [Mycolicibacterium wolinskyi]|uniref:DUF7159 domain-containing protein n=1 Tax=Mycolicibacterium wolinskyi TaxID=59750 RepID=A0A132PFF0_9MYCO|nr:hypothetical protein [Mycolicibacterium wolinskyi]KWX21004.1 hypothetical protein AFM11_28185 [Mycolicibacterium wolinskyi]
MDAVLGVSLTPSTVGLVLVEGHEADGATVDHETYDIRDLEPLALAEVTDRVVAAVARAEAITAERGNRLQSIGVTWSDGADIEASQLLSALSDAGFANVLPIRFPQATDTLARGIAGVVGFDTTVVCVIEPELILALTASPGDGPVQTTQVHGIETVQGLADWLCGLFAAATSRPDALVVVGSAVDFDAVMPKLQAALEVPVFTPADEGVALARGAALASARRGRFMFTEPARGPERRHWGPAQLAPAVMLAVGVITFVVSLSLAISHHVAAPEPEAGPRQTRPVVNVSGAPAATQHIPAAVIPPAPTSIPEVAPVVVEPPAAVEPAAPEFITEPEAGAVPADVPPPVVVPPAPAPEAVPPVLSPPVPTKKPLLTRIRDRLRGGPDVPEQQPFMGPVPPAPNAPPPGAVPPPVAEAPPPVGPEPAPPPPAPPAEMPPPEVVPPPLPPPAPPPPVP